MSKTGVKKNLRVNSNAATFSHPEDFHDDSSLRSLSSSFSGFSASVSRFDNLRSQDISILKVCKYLDDDNLFFIFFIFGNHFRTRKMISGFLRFSFLRSWRKILY